LAEVLQRRTPSWGNRPKDADNAAESRWRSQLGIVNKAENLTADGPKIGLTANKAENLTADVPKIGLTAQAGKL
jgi:hypothetical protein